MVRKKKRNQNEANDLMRSLFCNNKSDDGLPNGPTKGVSETKNPITSSDWRGVRGGGGYSPPTSYKRHSSDRYSESSVGQEKPREPEPDNWRSEDRKRVPTPSPDDFGQMREPEPDNWRSDKGQYTPPPNHFENKYNKSDTRSEYKSEKIQKDNSFWSHSATESDSWR